MAEIAAVLGAFGVPLVLVPRSRWATLGGLALIAAAEVLFASTRHPSAGAGGARPVRPGRARVAAAVLVSRPALVLPVFLSSRRSGFRSTSAPSTRSTSRSPAAARPDGCCRSTSSLAASALALAWRLVRGEDDARAAVGDHGAARGADLVRVLSYLWSDATGPARNLLVYFLLPFAVLVAVAGRAPFPAWMPRTLGTIAVALAALFAIVGLVEEATHRLIFYISAVEVGNAYSSFFRVTSLFRDPSLYGRHVVLGIAVLLVALLYRGSAGLSGSRRWCCCSPASSSRTRSRASSRSSP